MELISKLGIDGKLLLAQIVNFFILLAVLGKFVYKPVLDMLEKRSHTIETGVRNAKEADLRLQAIEKMRQEKMAETSREMGKMLDSARGEAEQMKKEIMTTAAAQSEDMLRRTRLQVEEEKQKMIQDVKREVSSFIIVAAQKILEREFSAADQKRLEEAVAMSLRT